MNAVDPTNPDGPKQATINLPRTIDVTSFAVDPGATCGDDDSASTRRLRIQTARPAPGAPYTTVGAFTFGAAANHRLNAVTRPPGQNVRRIRITMLDNQGGGPAAANFMDLSEFQVYGTP